MIYSINVLKEGVDDDLDYYILVEANTPEQAKNFVLKQNLIKIHQKIIISQPKVLIASLHQIKN